MTVGTERRTSRTSIQYRATCSSCPKFKGGWLDLNSAQQEAKEHKRAEHSLKPGDHRQLRSMEQEQRIAESHGGRRQRGSGSQWNRKGDVKTKTTLIEAKRTDAKQITLKDTVLDKIWREAWQDGLMPALVFELGGREWICHPHDEFIERYEGDSEDVARTVG